MDSRIATHAHIREVQVLILRAAGLLLDRVAGHDKTKLESPEVELFDELTPLLSGTTYGSREYNELLRRLAPALDHHYANNRHHPEHHPDGINGMTLIDLLEMVCDWMAAAKRHADGDVLKSIEINQRRFHYSNDLREVFLNTVKELCQDTSLSR